MTEAGIRAVAEAVVELLLERGLVIAAGAVHEGRVLTAAQAARFLGRRRQWVYEHAEELGGFRYGDGPRARFGFDRVELERWKQEHQIHRTSRNGREPRRRARRGTPARVENLIPFEPISEGRSIGESDPP